MSHNHNADSQETGKEHHPWRIMLLQPGQPSQCVATFRNRQDAEDFLRNIRRLAPQWHYDLVFHPPDESGASPA